MKAAIYSLALMVLLVPSVGIGAATAHREAAIKADGVTEVVIDAGAGFLVVRGEDDLAEIKATGEATASRKSALDDIRIEIRRHGDRVTIKSVYPRQFFNNAKAQLDLEVVIPSRVLLRITDGSGKIDVSGVDRVNINDGSGEIRVHQVAGDVTIEDGSGGISIEKVGGDVEIFDGSGEIRVSGVSKNVEVDDGSGEITVVDVDGTFTVINDGSGSINAQRIGGDFIVKDDGSGSIEYEKITGAVRIPKD